MDTGNIHADWDSEFEPVIDSRHDIVLKSMQHNRAGKYKCQVVDFSGITVYDQLIQVASLSK